MVTLRGLGVRFVEGAGLTDDLVRAMWSLRLDHLTLTRSEEEDWAAFRGFFDRQDTSAFVFHDSDGLLQGFYSITMLPFDHEGTRGLLLYSKWFYFREAYRGHPLSTLAPWLLLPLGLRRHGLRWLHFCTTTFPQSFVSLSRSSGNVRALQDPGISPWQQAALTWFARELFGDDFDEEAGVVRNQNVVGDADSVARGAEAEALREHYERRNPDWREGVSLPIVFRVDGTLVRTNVRRNLRRLARR